MSAIITTVLPVFGLIVLGYVLARAKVIDAAAGRGMSQFVFNVAVPALLFRTVTTMEDAAVAPGRLWLSFFGGLAIAWIAAALLSRRIASLNYSGGAAASMATGFGNLALLGTPLTLAHFGEPAAVPLGLILSIHAPTLWAAATVHRALARQSGALSLRDIAKDLFWQLATNAIVLALLAGAIWRATGLGLHVVPDKMLSMLADASIPTALMALGVSLASYSLKGAWGGTALLIALKMILMPLCVFIIASFVGMPPLWLKVAVLLAAMPTGANAFLFSQRNDEAVPAISAAIALGTGLAAITASILLWLMDINWI